jgi:hypothetical protein
MQFEEVQFGAVAFVLAEAILGKPGAKVAHNRIARDLGDHAGRGDAQAEAIAVDDRGLRERKREDGEAVDEDMVGLEIQGADGGTHRFVGGAQDIDRINLHGIDNSNRPRDRLIVDEFAVNFFAAFGEKLLRIVEPAMPEFFRKDDGGGYDRSGQRPAPGLIDAGDRGDTQGA